MSGVDNMLYMYSLNQAAGSQMQLRVDFDVTTDPSVDQVLTNLRYTQAASQLPPDVVNQGVTVKKSVTQPAGALRAVLAQGHLRLAVPRQLRVRQHQRPDDARARHRPGADLRRLAVRHPALGQSRHAGEARHHRQRDRQRAAGAEHREPGRPARRRPGAAAARSSPTRCWRRGAWRASRSSRTSWSAPGPTARWSGSRTWPAWSSARRTTSGAAA